jgi:pyruvate/2-oxoacid:ferredoxin oxidoreductase beta subunit
MDTYSLFAGQFLPFTERYLPGGHNACSGSGTALALRHVYKALEEKNADLTKARWDETPAGIFAPQEAAGAPVLILPKADESCLYICFDAESAAKKIKAEHLAKKNPAKAAASGCIYVATASPSHPFDLIEKIRRGWSAAGSAYIHILCPCPTDWGFDTENTVRIARMAVEARVFPLYEIVEGHYNITVEDKNPRTVADYIHRQDRFSTWKNNTIAALQKQTDDLYAQLKNSAAHEMN